MNSNNLLSANSELDYIPNKTCRTCWTKYVSHDLFQNDNDISRKLMAFANVEVSKDDGLPSHICSSCHHLINVSYNFKCQVEKADARMRSVLLKVSSSCRNIETITLQQSNSNLNTQTIMSEEFEKEVNCVNSNKYFLNQNEEIKSEIVDKALNGNDKGNFVTSSKHNEEMQSQMSKSVNNPNETNNRTENSSKELINEINLLKNEELSLSMSNNVSENENSFDDPKNSLTEGLKERLSDENMEKSKNESDNEETPLISRTKRQKCPDCIKTFLSRLSLQRHMSIHKDKEKICYLCYLCDEQFSEIHKLKSHLREFHDVEINEKKNLIKIKKDKLIETETCKDEQRSQENIKSERKNSKFSCKVCSKQFTYYKSFVTHAKSHADYKDILNAYPELVGLKSLDSFDKTCKNPKDSTNTKENESEDESMSVDGVQCKLCGKLFATKRNLKRHLLTHSGLKYNCSLCGKKFSRMDKLKEHEQSKHKEELYERSENEDSDEFTDDENKTTDNAESKKKEKSHNRPHKCSLCSKAFAQAQSLSNHMERHKRVKDTQKRFLCEVCSKCFAQSGSLVAHMRTHTGVKPYVCNVCSRAFTKSTYLQLHLRTHSGEKPYICQYCSRAFARANTLARHITMHTGEAKYHCQICTKSFRRLTSLNEHTYTHTGQRPYACKICSKRYNNAGSLYAHTKKCKAQKLSNQSTIYPVVSTENTNPQSNDTSVPQMTFLYSQKKLDEEATSEQLTSTPQFMIANVHTQKPLSTNIIQPFTMDDPNICTLNTKQLKTSYYAIYPSM